MPTYFYSLFSPAPFFSPDKNAFDFHHKGEIKAKYFSSWCESASDENTLQQ